MFVRGEILSGQDLSLPRRLTASFGRGSVGLVRWSGLSTVSKHHLQRVS